SRAAPNPARRRTREKEPTLVVRFLMLLEQLPHDPPESRVLGDSEFEKRLSRLMRHRERLMEDRLGQRLVVSRRAAKRFRRTLCCGGWINRVHASTFCAAKRARRSSRA